MCEGSFRAEGTAILKDVIVPLLEAIQLLSIFSLQFGSTEQFSKTTTAIIRNGLM